MQLLSFVALTQFAIGAPFPDGKFDVQGFIAGNKINSAVHAPVNSCNNSVTTIGGNSHFFNNSCSNTSIETNTDDHSNSNNGSAPNPDTSTSTSANDNPSPTTDTNTDTSTNPSNNGNGSIVGNVINSPIHNPVSNCNNSVKYDGEIPIYDHSCVNISIQSGNKDHSNQ
jgi:hypothetical protein